MRRLPSLIALPLLLATACGDSTTSTNDTGPGDAGAGDSGDDTPDAIVRDSGPRADVGPRDSGFSDPDTIRAGVEPVAGLRTYVRLVGTLTSTNPPVLFLHDGPGLGHEYLPPQMTFLAPGRLLVYYDMRASGRTSFGTSTETPTISADRHTLDVHDVVEWIGGHHDSSTVDLMGHGYGAGIAALYAAAHPERVGKLILTTPFPLTALQLATYNAEAQSRLNSGERTLINTLTMGPDCWGDFNQCTTEIWGILGPHYLCESNRALFRMMTWQYGDFRTREFVEYDLRERRYDWHDQLAAIRADTTIISGPCDPAPEETAREYAANIAGASHVVLMESGHYPFVEQRSEYQRAVLHALRR